jgi:accessory gene regulator B
MLNNAVNKITCILERHHVVNESNQEVIRYGIWILIFNTLSVLTALIIGVVMNGMIEVITFVILYKPLRVYAGGYHAKSPGVCCVVSALLTIAAVLAMKFVILPVYIIVGIWIVSAIVILILSPVEDKNKPLDELEIKVYKKRAIIVWAIEVILGLISVVSNLLRFAACMAWVLAAACVMVIAGKAKRIRENRNT